LELQAYTTAQLFAYLLIFVRIGAGLMFLPGIAETYVSMRVRLMLALTISLVIMPVVQPMLPPAPTSPLALAALLGVEILIGSFMGLISRVLVSAFHTAGMIISYQSSLASATMFDVTQASQGTAIGNFLSLTAVTLMFATNLHHLMLQGLLDSYTLFPAGLSAPAGDMLDFYSRLVGDAFAMALKISSPLIVVGLVGYLGMGLLARLMPTMQVFFIITPPQILMSFAILLLAFSGTMFWYLEYAEDTLIRMVE
jgi:flagellar biosynthetic protein FliR